MKAGDRLVLPRDLIISAPSSLSAETQARLGATAEERIVTRPHSRARSLVIDADGAAFLEQFRSPSTVVEAVLRHAEASGEPPEAILDAATPMLLRLREQRFIVVEGELAAASIEPTLARGAFVGDVEIIRCVHLFENVEVYEANRGTAAVALKILRDGASADSLEMLEREAAILTHLGGRYAPALLSRGTFEGRPYLVQSWAGGLPVTAAAAALRDGTPPLSELLALASSLTAAYAWLHEHDVVHGDVHGGNIRAGADGSITLLDFGLSRSAAAAHLPAPRRGGLADFFEPEYCAAFLNGRPIPAASAASDQYALAALVYLLLTGTPRQELSLDRDLWLRQVSAGGMRPFSDPWPALESVLARALDRDPAARFATCSDLRDAFDRAVRERRQTATPAPAPHAAFLQRVIERYVPNGVLPGREVIDGIRGPRCSFNYGAAGIAWFLYRLATLRGDARLLAAADVWCAHAQARSREEGAFASAEVRITPETVGELSPFHYVSGLHLTQALVARAMGDDQRTHQSARAFAAACSALGESPDLTLGWGSVLLGCATLVDALPDPFTAPVVPLGNRAAAAMTAWLSEREGTDPNVRWLGLAHGWAGFLYALLRWSEASGAELPLVARQRLQWLGNAGRRSGDAISWPYGPGEGPADRIAHTGWCHGSAGYVLLWTLADELLGGGFLALARGAAAHLRASLARDRNANGSLCCGFAGQGYALLALHRRTGEREPLALAEELCGRAIACAPNTNRPDSLYKGDPGIALLVEELARPALACMPLVESERWGRYAD
jgi:hypothetical protein